MPSDQRAPHEYVQAIRSSGLSIYDPIEVGDPMLWVTSPELETILNDGLSGTSLSRLPLRTRSKVVKEGVCRALGYPVPRSFQKTRPRFPGQNFDTYTQKSNNLQIWNEELDATRRYVILRVDAEDIIRKVRVVTGETLAMLDTTGTLTQKYQASLVTGSEDAELIAQEDTQVLRPFVSSPSSCSLAGLSPIDQPTAGKLLAIVDVFSRLRSLVRSRFSDTGFDQERTRGAELHRLVCRALGYSDYRDDGRFPDIRHQLLEVKLQTSPTIDLGLVCPDSPAPLDVSQIEGQQVRHCDVRYAIFYGTRDGVDVSLTHFYLTTGERFFSRFRQFQGKVLNKKIQIPLPSNFFDG